MLPHTHARTHARTHTHTHGPLSGTTQVSRYQKGKTNLDYSEERDSEWQWHQLGHMQICTLLQTNNNDSTPPPKYVATLYCNLSLVTCFLTLMFHKVVWQHRLGVVGFLITSFDLLQIY